ncbi:MAG: ABC transporter substrate-binding protein [Bowdeniella nasicola]|nr:ABC transporter substrate-binding protein [Bowdeniella nasicola]
MSHRPSRFHTLLAGLATCALALGGCTSSDSDDASTTSSSEAPTSEAPASSAPAEESDTEPLEEIRAYVPQTMAFGAPLSGFGSEGNLDGLAESTSVQNWDSLEQLKSALMNNEVEVAATPAYVAANLYNKGVDVRLVAPVVWGMLYVLGPEGTTPGDWEALRGQKVIVMLPGNMPDLVFSYLLKHNGMDRDKDIQVIPAQDGQQAMALLTKGEAQWVVVPEHLASVALMKMKKSGVNLTRALNLQEEWGKVTGKQARFPMAGLVMPGTLVDEHPDLVKAIRAEVAATVEKANAGDEATIAKIAETYSLPAPLVKDVIGRLQLEVVSGADAREEYEDFLTRLGEDNPKIYGGKLPDDRFYAE